MQQAGVDRLAFCTSAGVEARDPDEVLPSRADVAAFMLDQVVDLTWRHATPDPDDMRPRRCAGKGGRLLC